MVHLTARLRPLVVSLLAIAAVVASPAAAPGVVAAGPTSVVFTSTGKVVQQWTVPAFVTSVQFDAFGASSKGAGGYGAHVTGTLPVSPGQILDVWLGQEGLASAGGTAGGAGGWGGRNGLRAGGAGGPALNYTGFGGGGATEIDLHLDATNATVLVVAGGGGGAGYAASAGCGYPGAGGCGAVPGTGVGAAGSSGSGLTPPNLNPVVAAGGAGGTPTAGDASGRGQDAVATNGATLGGGGGGGGFRGGFAGVEGNSIGVYPGGGGAGGSTGPSGSVYGSGASANPVYAGPGKVTLTYTVPALAPAGATHFVPISPARLLDTRVATDITAGAIVAPGGGIDLQVTGRGGVPASNVTAVVLNVTAAESSGAGFVTVWPSGQTRPDVSNLNVTGVGQNIANLVTVKLGLNGRVSLFTQGGTHFVVDVEGYYEPVPIATSAGRFTPLTPSRILDTRSSNGVPGATPIPAGTSIDVLVSGRGGVPTTGVAAVVLNVTAADATGSGFVTVWPTGLPRPTASTLNVTFAGQNIPNLVIVPLGASGQISLYTQSGTHLLADVAGWFGDSTQPPSLAGLFEPLSPARILDTRAALGVSTTTPVAPNGSINVSVIGVGGVPAGGVSAVVLNVTAAEATAPGFVTVWPANLARPTVSNLNVTAAGQNIPNLVEIGPSPTGTISMFAAGGTHLLADVAGYYLAG